MAERHVSVTYDVSDIKLGTCQTCCSGGSESYHCPLCLPSIFKPTQKRTVQQHLQTHYENRVTYDDIHMLPCQLNCVKTKSHGFRGHFHCPFCDVTRSRRESILDHVRNCKSNPNTLLNIKKSRDSEMVSFNEDTSAAQPGTHDKDQKGTLNGKEQEMYTPNGSVMGAGGDKPQIRKRGRPPKKRPIPLNYQPTSSGDSAPLTIPTKSTLPEGTNIKVMDETERPPPLKRGRPPKNPKVTTLEAPILTVRENQSSLLHKEPQGDVIYESNAAENSNQGNVTNKDKDLSEEVGNILVSLSEGKLELQPMEASDNSVSPKVLMPNAAVEREDLSKSNKTSQLGSVEPRVSRRLAVKRESGQNFVWEALMKSVRGEQLSEANVDEAPMTRVSLNRESPKKVVNRTQVTSAQDSKGVAKRGPGRPRKTPPAVFTQSRTLQVSKREELPKDCQTLEKIMSKNDPESSEIFSQAAAMISGRLLQSLSISTESLITDIADRAGLTVSSPDGASYFLHGSLEGLLIAREMLSKLQEEQVLKTSNLEKGLQPPELGLQSAEMLGESLTGEKEENRLSHREAENLVEQAAEDEVVSMAVDFHVDSGDDNLDGGDLGETVLLDLDDCSSRNPATGRRYSRLCAMYRNPELADAVCDVCGFRSTAKGIQKHKLRFHPERLHLCECCGRTFGVRYDMRRHRLRHFDSAGKMFPDAMEIYRTYNPEVLSEVTLRMIEGGLDVEESIDQGMKEGEVEETKDSEACVLSEEIQKDESEGNSAGVLEESVLSQDGTSQDNTSRQPDTANKIALSSRVKVANSLARKNPGKAMYLCDQCGFRSSLAGLNKHKQRHHPQLVFCCTLCDVKFGIVNDLLRHYKTHESNTKVYTIEDVKENAACGMCDFKSSEKSVKSHLVEQHQTSKVNCTHCDATFTSQKLLQKHFRKIHPDLFRSALPAAKVKHRLPRDESRKVCNICGAKIRTSWFAYHMKTHNRVTLVCDECGFSTEKRFEMKSHMKVKHGPAQYICHICGQTFTLPHSHKTHMRSKHSDTPPAHLCSECGKVFTDKRFLMTHYKRMHLKEKKFFCDICGKGFFEKIRMKEHRTIHTSEQEREAQKTLECKYCGRRFRKAQQLSQHENTHTGNRPYKCKLCGKGYAWASEIHKHMRTHTDDRPFQCTECGRSFKFRYKLATHMITHTRKSRHICNLCGKVFTVLSTLKRHRCKMALTAAQGTAATTIDLSQIASTSTQEEEQQDEATTHVFIQVENDDQVIPGENLLQLSVEENDGEVQTGEDLVTYMCGLCRQLFQTPQEINEHVMYVHGESVTVVVEDEENPAMSEVVMTTTDTEEGIVAHLETVEGQEEVGFIQQGEISEQGLLEHQIELVQQAVEVEQNEVELEGAADDPVGQQIILVQNVVEENAETVVMEDIGQEVTHVLLEQS